MVSIQDMAPSMSPQDKVLHMHPSHISMSSEERLT